MQPLFSIEQVELIRRLRNSGITKEQVIHAFESFERIDEDLGMLYTIPRSLASTASLSMGSSRVENSLHNENGRKRRQSNNTDYSDSALSEEGSDITASSVNRTDGMIGVVERKVYSNGRDFVQNKRLRNDLENGALKIAKLPYTKLREKSLQQQCPSSSSVFIPQTNSPGDLHEDYSDMNSLQCGDRPSIASTSSQFVHDAGNVHQFESVSHSPQSFSSLNAAVEPSTQGQCARPAEDKWKTFKLESYSGTRFTPRRERFTFREKHLEVLEAYFKMNPYPINEEREIIANKCNAALALSTGRELDEKETVTNQNVQTWFSNRRKGNKRQTRTEGTNSTEVSLALPNRMKSHSDSGENCNVVDHAWSTENKNFVERNANLSDVIQPENIKSEPCPSPDESQKQENYPEPWSGSSSPKPAKTETDSSEISQLPALVEQGQKNIQNISENRTNDNGGQSVG